jgi:hypothetical protein
MLKHLKSESNQALKEFSICNLSLRLRRELGAFHVEERGASGSVDNIMLIFVAAIILVALATLVDTTIWTRVTTEISNLLDNAIGT